MDTTVNKKDFELLSQDKYTFEVLSRILGGQCELVLTDHENIIFCHSCSPYPVWIWTRDGCSDSVKEKAWNLICENRPLEKGFRFNIKYDLAEYVMEKAKQSDMNAGYETQMFAYDCPSVITPDEPTDGNLYSCTDDDIEEAAGLIKEFNEAVGETPSKDHCVEKARLHIGYKSFFFWKNAEGKTVACCSFNQNNGIASVGSVYTKPEFRRNHYAQHLVYEVTKIIKNLEFMPMLYTDANYVASNSCYTKIGYELRGKLCTVALIK